MISNQVVPVEIFEKVFSFLDNKAMSVVVCVNKSWHNTGITYENRETEFKLLQFIKLSEPGRFVFQKEISLPNISTEYATLLHKIIVHLKDVDVATLRIAAVYSDSVIESELDALALYQNHVMQNPRSNDDFQETMRSLCNYNRFDWVEELSDSSGASDAKDAIKYIGKRYIENKDVSRAIQVAKQVSKRFSSYFYQEMECCFWTSPRIGNAFWRRPETRESIAHKLRVQFARELIKLHKDDLLFTCFQVLLEPLVFESQYVELNPDWSTVKTLIEVGILQPDLWRRTNRERPRDILRLCEKLLERRQLEEAATIARCMKVVDVTWAWNEWKANHWFLFRSLKLGVMSAGISSLIWTMWNCAKKT